MEMTSTYSVQRIRNFLRDTKGMRAVKVEEHFPDLQLFHDSVRYFMENSADLGQPSFTDQEIFRLRMFIVKVRNQLSNDD